MHLCNALEFDIVGTGGSKAEAFSEMKELVEEYLLSVVECLSQGEKVRFFNPADNDEWNKANEIHHYDVTFIISDLPGPLEISAKSISRLAPYRKAMKGVDLIPA